MCGIAGILGRVDERNRAALARMARCLAHRGPDAEGMWESPLDDSGFGCMLAHRRLSILDLSHGADQPMTDPVTGQTIVFNGEIYNYRALRDELQAAGERFDSTGDTAVMLRLLSQRGPQGVSRLRGMFAYGLWDPAARELTLARDALGIKPLYVCENPDPRGDWKLLFASEVRALLGSGLLDRPRLNPDAVASVVWNGFVMGPGTAVKGIESLAPGELRTYGADGRRKESTLFWSFQFDDQPPIDEQTMADALAESVRLHLASDVPLGVFLSSGVDSSVVANLAQQASDDQINTFTLAFEEEALNEGHHARRIAEAIGTRHHEILLTEQTFVQNIERALDTLDQPTFDGLNSFYMSQAVREAGLTVALVGTGGDELFGGYTSFRDLPRLAGLARRAGWMPRSARSAAARAVAFAMQARQRGGAVAVAPQTRWAKLPDLVARGDDIIALYQLAYALFLPDFQRELLPTDRANGSMTDGIPTDLYRRLERETRGRSTLGAVSVLEQRCFLGERLLRDTDAASMAVSLEVRLPLVDQRVVELAHRLPDAARFGPVGRKAMLRRIGQRGLDPALFDRPKSGFVLPFDRWLRQSLGSEMDQTMRDPAAAAAVGLNGEAVSRLWKGFRDGQPGLYWSRVWALYVLIRWCQRHGLLV